MLSKPFWTFWSLSLVALTFVSADDQTHQYFDGEELVVWTDKVGPYNNPQETYNFEKIGLCELQGVDVKRRDDLSIGEALEGHELVSSPRLNIKFGVDVSEPKEICTMTLSKELAQSLENKIRDNYWYQLYIDDLPQWAFIGEPSSNIGEMLTGVQFANEAPNRQAGQTQMFIYTHRHFSLSKNGNQIIEFEVETSDPKPVKEGETLQFKYSVSWQSTDQLFKNRFEKYLETKFFEHKVHWFSIVNSFMLSLFLVAVVTIILMKTLKKDFSRYTVSEVEELDNLERPGKREGNPNSRLAESYGKGDEFGWKQVHGDVFRRPSNLLFFSTLYSSGLHLAATVLCVTLLAIANSYYTTRGTTGTSAVVAYILTTCIAGYHGGKVYRMYGGRTWKKAMVYQVCLVPGLVWLTFLFVNTTAWAYGSTQAIPFKTILVVVLLFLALCLPLHGIGTLIGRKAAQNVSFPCRVHHLKRPIPPRGKTFVPGILAVSGLVPFGCVFIEMYFLFSSFWSYNKIYYVYGFMLAVLLLLSLVLVCVSITCVYVLLNSEDHRWAWHSFLSCGSTALYVFLYAVYFFHNSTQMSGFLQWMYYFGASSLFCACFGIMCGAIGHYGATLFVFLIYRNIKSD